MLFFLHDLAVKVYKRISSDYTRYIIFDITNMTKDKKHEFPQPLRWIFNLFSRRKERRPECTTFSPTTCRLKVLKDHYLPSENLCVQGSTKNCIQPCDQLKFCKPYTLNNVSDRNEITTMGGIAVFVLAIPFLFRSRKTTQQANIYDEWSSSGDADSDSSDDDTPRHQGRRYG